MARRPASIRNRAASGQAEAKWMAKAMDYMLRRWEPFARFEPDVVEHRAAEVMKPMSPMIARVPVLPTSVGGILEFRPRGTKKLLSAQSAISSLLRQLRLLPRRHARQPPQSHAILSRSSSSSQSSPCAVSMKRCRWACQASESSSASPSGIGGCLRHGETNPSRVSRYSIICETSIPSMTVIGITTQRVPSGECNTA